MSSKPVVLIYDLDNDLVDECAALIGQSGLFTAINTYNETNALEALQQYDRFLGIGTNKLSCIVTGWNSYKKPRDQFLFSIRNQEKKSAFRQATPVIMISEDHRFDLRQMALDPTDGFVSAYLQREGFQADFTETLKKVVIEGQMKTLNSIAYAKLQQEAH